ncbi:MAG: RluA family pseudouridine synthase [Bacteroidota bacterium]|nr:RNA pseudouridine synthase [Odoribacter sp.]MDP3644072.1 RluA family pseudouridine synthase [Bacteroidota bacterium]
MKYPQKKSEFRPEKLKEIAVKVSGPTELLKFLIEKFPEKSRTAIKLMLAHKQVSVGDLVTTQFDFPLNRGQIVYLNKKKSEEKIRFRDLKIVHEDVDLIVVEKGSGLSSVASEKENVKSAQSLLTEYVRKFDLKNQVYVIHRLDRDTSGLMMFAKSKKVQEALQKEWSDSLIEDTYVVVVEGVVEKLEGSITSWLKENKAFQVISSQTPDDGQKAVTHYKVLKISKLFSLLEVKPETSRKNQIRVHLKDMGFPIAGDKKYGGKLNPVGQIGLHCKVLSLKHPVTGKTLRIESPIPGKFMKLFR